MNLRGLTKHKGMASSCILLVMFLSLALKALLPTGFMPVIGQDGFTELVICSGMGEKTILVPNDENAPSDHKNDKPAKVCAYQILVSGKSLISPPLAFIPSPLVLSAVFEKPVDATFQPSIHSAFAARGPPSLLI